MASRLENRIARVVARLRPNGGSNLCRLVCEAMGLKYVSWPGEPQTLEELVRGSMEAAEEEDAAPPAARAAEPRMVASPIVLDRADGLAKPGMPATPGQRGDGAALLLDAQSCSLSSVAQRKIASGH